MSKNIVVAGLELVASMHICAKGNLKRVLISRSLLQWLHIRGCPDAPVYSTENRFNVVDAEQQGQQANHPRQASDYNRCVEDPRSGTPGVRKLFADMEHTEGDVEMSVLVYLPRRGMPILTGQIR